MNIKPSLNQGNFFNKLSSNKKKYAPSYKSIEKFTTKLPYNLKTESIMEKKNLLTEYQLKFNVLKQEYDDLIKQILDESKSYLERTNPSNIYSNNFIKFFSGELFYVTGMGVAKYIENLEDLENTGVEYDEASVINIDRIINVPENYKIYGNNIATSPPLITGTPVTPNKLLVNTDINLHANRMINNTNSNFEGCYTNTPTQFSVPDINRMSIDDCKEAAIIGGYKFYGLKNTNLDDLLGTCSISNDDKIKENNIADDCNLVDNNNYGGINSIATYAMEKTGIPDNLNKYGYVDGNAILHSYPDNIFAPPLGVSDELLDVDTIEFGNYKLGSLLNSNKYGLKISNNQKERLVELNNEMNSVSRQINDISVELRLNNNWVNNQINNNYDMVSSAIDEIDNSNQKIDNLKTNGSKYENMRNDSDITLLNKNYTFILFSILATGTLIIALNISNKT